MFLSDFVITSRFSAKIAIIAMALNQITNAYKYIRGMPNKNKFLLNKDSIGKLKRQKNKIAMATNRCCFIIVNVKEVKQGIIFFESIIIIKKNQIIK